MALAGNICAPLGTLSTFSFNPVFQLSTAKNEINLFKNHVLIVASVTFASAGATPPSAEFLFFPQTATANGFSMLDAHQYTCCVTNDKCNQNVMVA